MRIIVRDKKEKIIICRINILIAKEGETVIMKGVGIDIIEIERIREGIERHSRFKERFFTEKEIKYCEKYKVPWPHYAGRFAAKEAVVKALGTGFRGFKWKDVQIVKDELGKPEVRLFNGAKDLALEKGIEKVMISISHSRDYAVAQALAL